MRSQVRDEIIMILEARAERSRTHRLVNSYLCALRPNEKPWFTGDENKAHDVLRASSTVG